MKSSPSVKGFTLVELLSVIAIIGVLAAIIIPSVSAVRASSKKTQCTSNLRQTAQAYLMFFADNKGSLKNESKQGDGTIITTYNPGHINLGQSLYLGAPDKSVHTETEVSPLALTSEFKTKFAVTTAKNKAYYKTTSYWHNPHVWRVTRNTNSLYAESDAYGIIGPLEPTRMAMLSVADHDALQASSGQMYIWEWSPERFEYYNGSSTSLAFFDGHVETVSKDKLSPRWAAGR